MNNGKSGNYLSPAQIKARATEIETMMKDGHFSVALIEVRKDFDDKRLKLLVLDAFLGSLPRCDLQEENDVVIPYSDPPSLRFVADLMVLHAARTEQSKKDKARIAAAKAKTLAASQVNEGQEQSGPTNVVELHPAGKEIAA